MEIEAMKMVAAQLPHGATPATPSVVETAEVEAFTRALFGQGHGTPEEAMANQFQAKSLQVNTDLDGGGRSATEITHDPAEMLAAQSAILNSAMEVDLIAKVAGSVSQGVNKLVSMA